MYNKEMVKELFIRAGIGTDIVNYWNRGFELKVKNGNTIYFWENQIVSKKEFQEKAMKYCEEKNKGVE